MTKDRTIAILFMIGSACFALGAVPGYAGAAGVTADGVTFFAGSLFFTSAAYGQFRESGKAGERRRQPRNWWATVVQLAGTVFFNVSTLHALVGNLDALQQDRQVWRPDAFGSVCFLVASALSLSTVGSGWLSRRSYGRSRWIALVNMCGSVAFAISAVASYVVPDSGLPRNAMLVNLGTFVGALCFLLGAYLLMPRSPAQPIAVPAGGTPAAS